METSLEPHCIQRLEDLYIGMDDMSEFAVRTNIKHMKNKPAKQEVVDAITQYLEANETGTVSNISDASGIDLRLVSRVMSEMNRDQFVKPLGFAKAVKSFGGRQKLWKLLPKPGEKMTLVETALFNRCELVKAWASAGSQA